MNSKSKRSEKAQKQETEIMTLVLGNRPVVDESGAVNMTATAQQYKRNFRPLLDWFAMAEDENVSKAVR